ncbi:MAG: GyrI-like domain-containing protein [Muribaculaceae bacterium]|nr:GyrI-like domain-containing protein [Muribaculaceae bacterium]
MAFDYKKEYKGLYMPKATPTIVEVPEMKFIAVNGCGNPNEPDGEYQQALSILYPVAYALKMSHKTDYRIDGFFEYVVPPLEGLWWTDNAISDDFTDKSAFRWIAMIRVPDFADEVDVEWAKSEVFRKKGLDCSTLYHMSFEEGLCSQIMHTGSYDTEPVSLDAIDRYIESNGYMKDITAARRHHEIYISDPRKCSPEKMKTVLRIPVAKRK